MKKLNNRFNLIKIFNLFLLILLFLFVGCKEEKNDNPIDDEDNKISETVDDKEIDKPIENVVIEKVSFSDDLFKEASDKINFKLAKFSLDLCCAQYMSTEFKMLNEMGFEVLLHNNFDKSISDKSHTSAYDVATKEISLNGETRTLVLVLIRGTTDGEWYSNFDFAKCKNSDAIYADNFLDSAKDVFYGMQEEVELIDNPLFLVTGHSRGASTANLLGTLLNDEYGKDNVYCYTFATPTTVRKEKLDYNSKDYDNIFNFINASDIVPCLPLGAWGYSRFGVDYYMFNLSTTSGEITSKLIKSLAKLCPTIERYYNEKISLKHSGIDEEDGIILFDLINELCDMILDDPYDIDISNFDILKDIASSSDLFDLVSNILIMAGDGGKVGMEVLNEHMPETYVYLLNVIDKVNE